MRVVHSIINGSDATIGKNAQDEVVEDTMYFQAA